MKLEQESVAVESAAAPTEENDDEDAFLYADTKAVASVREGILKTTGFPLDVVADGLKGFE